MSSPKMEVEEDDEEVLRRAALKTMSRFKGKLNANQSTDSFQQNIRTNNGIKNKAFSHRNGSKRSNLIILTKTDTQLSKSHTDSHSNRFTKIMEKTSEASEKRKRVLPGRFSRLERDDEDSDEDTDECSDDNQLTNNSAFNQTSDEQTVVFNAKLTSDESVSAQINANEANDDLIVDNNSSINDSTNASINVKSLATNCTPIDPISSDLERKETIKLNSNYISKSEAFERRKQKFGETSSEERVNPTLETRNQKSSVKNRLSLKPNNKQKNSNKNSERNYKKSVSDKEFVASHRHHPNSRTDSIEESDDCHHSKKRLRSLVVMK